MTTDETNELADVMEASWKPFRDTVARLQPDDLFKENAAAQVGL